VYRLVLCVFAVGLIAIALGCETELQRQQRRAAEDAERMDSEFEAKLNKVIDRAKGADKTDPDSILRVIGELEAIQGEAMGVDQNLQTMFTNVLLEWNDAYLALGFQKFKELKKAADRKVAIDDFEGAAAEMDKFPKSMLERGPFADIIEKQKEMIKSFAEAPDEAHAVVKEVVGLIDGRQYEKAMQVCEEYFRSLEGKPQTRAIYFVISKHLAAIEGLLDELIAAGKYDEALKKAREFKETPWSNDHVEFLDNKIGEIENKKAAAGE
jgi:tetratricopeptide (TPR) repeat protein